MMLFTDNKLARTGMGVCAVLLAVAAIAVGCGGSKVHGNISAPRAATDAYLQDKPAELRPLYEKIPREGQRNLVLNQLQAGLAAMHLGYYDLAKESFDQALLRIEAVYANNPTAKKARSLWYEEEMKDFKGEPYERAMAYYYRGLLYLREGDFENARACFKSGVLQDAFAEERQNRCDFALLIFLEGWASQCNGDWDLTEAAYKEVKKLRPDFVPPERDHDTLIIAETGTSPRKVADGVGHYELKYRRGKNFTEQRARTRVGERVHDMYPMEDIAWQAMTRGGRPVDKILKGQVVFRQTHEKVGSALTDVSANAMILAPVFEGATGEIQAVSAALGLIGVAEMAIAARARPRADTRYWRNLPDAVHIFTCNGVTDGETVEAQFFDPSGSEITSLRSQGQAVRTGDGHGFAWLRSRPAMLHDQ